ncbi:MAG: hypothetical protein ACOCVR_02700 [Myxococcota bacterium]
MRTLRALLVVTAVCFLSSGVASAQDYTTGGDAIAESGPLGVGLGQAGPISGLGGRLMLGDRAALQGVVGVSYHYRGWYTGLGVALDYTMDAGTLVDLEEVFRLNWYVGGGGTLALTSRPGFGAGAVVGVSFRLRTLPLEITGELRPTFVVGD